MRHRLSRRADRDVESLYRRSIAEHGEAHADRYYDGLLDSFRWIENHPLAARERTEQGRSVRIHHYGVHAVIYSILADDTILIVRVLHGRQDLRRGLRP
ncbi:MAG: plasmid stabilization system family protein [Devosia sp.]|uniref:type II toxin-antitoxin system RelE/ParE family toxin n=1 Tax=Devosia sp. TaxID=1871048 RepID=UPI0026373CF2|nr:type II toxin-antitoxin system RelE/ParE family toxin [Devosia sp.]MDB5539833.1 plasmid stabilization system family protein [Devosia sp.]